MVTGFTVFYKFLTFIYYLKRKNDIQIYLFLETAEKYLPTCTSTYRVFI
jgi:hypothetical protein